MISFSAIQPPFSVPANATDEARIAAILAILEKENVGRTGLTSPAIDQGSLPQPSGNHVYHSWREAADSLLETLEQDRDSGLRVGSELNAFDNAPNWLPQERYEANYLKVGGRGVPPIPRRITTPGRLEWQTYIDLIKKLGELNPHHPLVASPAARRPP